MEKIIDASALIDHLRILKWGNHLNRESALELAIIAVEAAGTEVVRCRDCVFCRRKQEGKRVCIVRASGGRVFQVDANHYCSKGKRRDDR